LYSFKHWKVEVCCCCCVCGSRWTRVLDRY